MARGYQSIEHVPGESRALPGPLWLSLAITVALTIFAWSFAAVAHSRGLPKPYSWPYYTAHQTALAPHGDRFGDFLVFADQMPKLHKPWFFTGNAIFNYPPAAALFFRATTWPFAHKAIPYVVLVLCLVAVAALFAVRKLLRAGVSRGQASGFVLGSLLFSFPLQFELARANLEFLIVCFTATGVWMVWRRRYLPAAFLLGIAASMKLFPFILFGLFLPLKRYRDFALAWAVFAAMTLAGLLAETPSLTASFRGTVVGFAAFSNLAVTGLSEYVGYDHSILALLKVVTQGTAVNANVLGARYLPVAAVVASILYFARIWWLPLLNRILALMLCVVLLPPFSADYTLLHLYAPLLLLVLAMARGTLHGVPRGVEWTMMVCIGLVNGMESFVIVHGRMYGAQVRCVALLAMLGLVLWFPMRVDGDAAGEETGRYR